MLTIKREVLQEFHYALDGKNASRKKVGRLAEIRAEDEERLAGEGRIRSDLFPGPAAPADEPADGPRGRKRTKAAKPA